jgi:hypothetical protein
MLLGEFGLNLGPLIASAGVLGVALGCLEARINSARYAFRNLNVD